MKRVFIKKDKLGRICDIYYFDGSGKEAPEFKPTLNMFRGRQFASNLTNCLNYLKLSIAAQNGDSEAEKELSRIHYIWNHHEEA